MVENAGGGKGKELGGVKGEEGTVGRGRNLGTGNIPERFKDRGKRQDESGGGGSQVPEGPSYRNSTI